MAGGLVDRSGDSGRGMGSQTLARGFRCPRTMALRGSCPPARVAAVLAPAALVEYVMSSIAVAHLSAEERALLDRYVEVLVGELGDELRAVWLFGSRARGEDTGEESDVDVLVLVDDDSWARKERIRALLHGTAAELGVKAVGWLFAIHVHTLGWLRDRRRIGSFFIDEVDRDKVVLAGRA